jgi:6-phosphogluconolactonase
MYAIDAQGKLTALGHESVRGDVPRNFMISGNQLLVANQNSEKVVVFEIQPNGLLLFNDEIKVGTPVCLRSTTVGD